MVARTKRRTTAPTAKRAKVAAIAPIEALSRDVFLHLLSFLQPNEALRLASTSLVLDRAMDDRVWRAMLLHQLQVQPSLLKPRTQTRKMVVNLAQKKSCEHCDRFMADGCRIIKVHTKHRGKRLCDSCFELPMFNEISHMDAIAEYKLTNKELRALRYRLVTVGDYDLGERFKTTMYNLQAVLDLVAKLRS
ncbi:hypothetical protein SPRG_09449 [Saprolegnia parasitica CBS 223.65]|uniref:F-box domain-containing protein n=1 Tax=Saprolegnia parasitica (strain CBS 223.65) TaxID=695850 RepID=A0A067C363_SAPPC|nr:hypothetical protein SPRG_09449 [Saprolegnia parasitica CBS 223.65]KDO25174.1 hypothetical protein SPRG_09449 [Saprolegnia parasitica CBS 223.65]|eukprot:XP_012204040.1 hypothetical protein SPRG_09449 [Saprolegnia parasitica CBS 223.65]